MNIPKEAIEEKRLMRAIGVRIFEKDERGDPLPDGCYLAYSGNEPHYVRVRPELDCDCEDYIWKAEPNDLVCKHLIKALYVDGNEMVRSQIDSKMG